MNPTYEMSRAGSEHADKRQRNRPVNQLPLPHDETQSHDAAMSTRLLVIVSALKSSFGTLWEPTADRGGPDREMAHSGRGFGRLRRHLDTVRGLR